MIENWEDEKLTRMINEEALRVEEAGGAGFKLCFLCRSSQHLACNCGMRRKNLSSAMGMSRVERSLAHCFAIFPCCLGCEI